MLSLTNKFALTFTACGQRDVYLEQSKYPKHNQRLEISSVCVAHAHEIKINIKFKIKLKFHE